MSPKQPTQSKSYKEVKQKVRQNTPPQVITLIARQIDRAEEIGGQGASVYDCDNFEDFKTIVERHLNL